MKKAARTPKLPLSPGRKLFLLVWTTLAVCLSFVILAKTTIQIRMGGVIVGGVVGLLLGLKVLRKLDSILVALGLVNPQEAHAGKPSLEHVVDFLRKHRSRGQFSKKDFVAWCHQWGFEPEGILPVLMQKGWVLERQNQFLITSQGEEFLSKSL